MAEGKKRALVAWGGWEGHEPEACAQIVAGLLREAGFAVAVEHGTAAFADPALHQLALIVPICTMMTIERAELDNLCAAVEGGVGLGGYHGGMGDAFRGAPKYQFMCGGQWVAHPGNIIDYRVQVTRPDDPVMAGIEDFDYRSEQYYMHVDPVIEVLATTTFSGAHARLDRGRRDAGGLEKALRPGPRVLQLARPRRRRVRGARDAHDPAARPALGGALTGSSSSIAAMSREPCRLRITSIPFACTAIARFPRQRGYGRSRRALQRIATRRRETWRATRSVRWCAMPCAGIASGRAPGAIPSRGRPTTW